MTRSRAARASLVACVAIAATACGSHSYRSLSTDPAAATPTATAAARAARTRSVPDGDWTTFDYNGQRSGVGPSNTGISAANARSLSRRAIHIGGVADSSPIELHAISIKGRSHDVAIVTTTYGRTIAFDPASGSKLWEFVPSDIASYRGSAQITTASPVADPDRRYVYAASPDGMIHKLAVATGHQVWAARVTFDPRREKIEGGLNLAGRDVLVATGGYTGDAPTYEGHVVLLRRSDGHVADVWNAECSDRHHLLDPPRSCPADTTFGGSAIWGREGVVIEPRSHDLVVATGNGPFNGSTNWGDSVVVLSPDASRNLHTWTPRDQQQLNAQDMDLGSTEPALLPGGLSVQGGKSGTLALLDLAHQGIGATGGELQTLPAPGGSEVFPAPAVWRDYVFVANSSGIAAYRLSKGRLHQVWQDPGSGTSPVVAGGLLYVYDNSGGTLRILEPTTGRIVATLPAAPGHWSSPIVVGGRVLLPVGGSSADNAGSGTVFVYHLPGR